MKLRVFVLGFSLPVFVAKHCGAAEVSNAARASARPPTRVTLQLADMAGTRETARFKIFEASGPTFDPADLSPGEIKDAPGLIRAIQAGDDSLSGRLRAALLGGGASDRLEAAALARSLNLLIHSGELIHPDMFAHRSRDAGFMTQVARIVDLPAHLRPKNIADDATAPDAVERQKLATQLSRRLLDDTYPTFITRSRAMAEGGPEAPWCEVSPGDYWVLPVDHPALVQRVAVREGQSHEFEAEVADSLWLNLRGDPRQATSRVLLRLRDAEGRRAAAARLWQPGHRMPAEVGRPGVSTERVQAALILARQALAAWPAGFAAPAGTAPADENKLERIFALGSDHAWRILVAHGDATDTRWLAARATPGNAAQTAMRLAFMESRLGTFGTGELAGWLAGGEPRRAEAAAMALAVMGVPQGQARVRELLVKGSTDDASLMTVLNGDGTPATLAAVRSAFARAIAGGTGTAWVVGASVPTLLAQGDAADWRQLSRTPLLPRDVLAFAIDIKQLLPLLLTGYLSAEDEDGRLSHTLALAFSEPRLRYLPGTRSARAWGAIEDGLAAAVKARDRTAGNTETVAAAGADAVMGDYLLRATFHRPSERMARFFFRANEPTFVKYAPWIVHSPEAHEVIRGGVVSGAIDYAQYEDQLGYMPPAVLAAEFKRLDPAGKNPGLPVILAAREVVTRNFVAPDGGVADGVERRPFLVRAKDADGAISGVLEIKPRVVGKKVVVAAKFELAPYYHVGGFIDFNEGDFTKWALHRYVLHGGRALLENPVVIRGGKTLPLQWRGTRDDGAHLYEAELGDVSAGFDGLSLTADLVFFDQRHTFGVAIHAGAAARSWRLAAGTLPASARGDAAGHVATLRNMGRIDDAVAVWQKALARGAGDPALAEGALDFYLEENRQNEAQALLFAKVENQPADAEARAKLARSLLFTREYRRAAVHATQVTKLRPDDAGARYLFAMTLLLMGDRSGALAALAAVPADFQPERVWPVRYLLAQEKGGEAAKELRAAAEARLRGTEPYDLRLMDRMLVAGDEANYFRFATSPTDICRTRAFAGWAARLRGDRARAEGLLREALATGRDDQLEFRVAEEELKKFSPSQEGKNHAKPQP